MMFRSLVLSCSLLGFLAGGAVMAMEDDNKDTQHSITLKKGEILNNKEESRKDEKDESSLFNQLPTEDKATILEFVAFDVGAKKGNLSELALVCKHWNDIVNSTDEQIKHRIKKVWLRGLYNIIDPKEVEIFEQFYNGKLIYRPDPASNAGMVTLSISALKNPLEGTFDLSNCGDAGKYLSIATGYRKGIISSNSEKVEVWIALQFLIERKLGTTAAHFNPIMDIWKEEQAPVGIFFTWGGWDNLGCYEYLTTKLMESMESLRSGNLKQIYREVNLGCVIQWVRVGQWYVPKFHILFVN